MSDLITSPEGTIQYLALRNKTRNKPGDDENTVYTVKLEIDGSTKEGKEFRKEIEAINKNIVSTRSASTPNHFTVKASSQFFPTVLDTTGELLQQEDCPTFYPGSTGRATLMVKPYTGNKLGGAINLIGVGLKSLQLAEKPEDSTGATSSADIVARLRASLNNK